MNALVVIIVVAVMFIIGCALVTERDPHGRRQHDRRVMRRLIDLYDQENEP